ncbi:MAG: immunity 63 family protein [Clostridiales bacterium]|jgi:hypothetical protein|nr:immunity 63 family protein [Clostridiales bacterium]
MIYTQLEKNIVNLLQKAGIPESKYDIKTGPVCQDGLYYEMHGGMYEIVYHDERGNINVLVKTEDQDELYYFIVKDIVKNYAIDYEAKNRIKYQDFRRIYFDKALELIKKIDEKYCEKLQNEFNEILKDSPFDDNGSIQSDFVDMVYHTLKKVDIHFTLNRKINGLKKHIKELLNYLRIYRYANLEDFKEIVTETKKIVTKIRDYNIKIDDSSMKDLEIAISKGEIII